LTPAELKPAMAAPRRFYAEMGATEQVEWLAKEPRG